MKSEIKEIKTISGELIDFVWGLDDHTPIEVFTRTEVVNSIALRLN